MGHMLYKAAAPIFILLHWDYEANNLKTEVYLNKYIRYFTIQHRNVTVWTHQ